MRKSLFRWALIATFLAVPAAVVISTLALKMGASLSDCLPVDSDEVHYWNEIACFVRAGLASGYCVDDEQPARASWTRFGPHGPGFPILYGLPACIVGWQPASGPFFNLVVVAIASGIWLWLSRPSLPTLGVGILLIGTFWPLMIYLPSTMQEPLHCAIALVLAGLARRAFVSGASSHIPFVAAVAIASLIKFSWILVLIPWAVAVLPGATWRAKITILLTTASGIVAAVWIFTVICSPYPGRLTPEIRGAWNAPMLTFWTLELRWETGWKQLLLPSSAPLIGLLQRYEILAVGVLGAGLLLWRKYSRPAAFAAINVLALLITTMLIFDMWGNRDYRLLAPHMLLSLLLLLSTDWRLVLPFVAANLAFAGVFVSYFAEFHRERIDADWQALAVAREELTPHMSFRPVADGWSNTLLFPVHYQNYRLLALPPGIGITFVIADSADPLGPKRSRFVVLPPGAALSPRMRLRLLAKTSIGPLYANLNFPDDSSAKPP